MVAVGARHVCTRLCDRRHRHQVIPIRIVAILTSVTRKRPPIRDPLRARIVSKDEEVMRRRDTLGTLDHTPHRRIP
jgi:hypothetical protein